MDRLKTITPRDPGLDLIRALALFLMVGSHVALEIPISGPVAGTIKFIAASAPAFFFFGFGMTFDRFMSKDRDFKVESSLLFLYVALVHNIYLGRIFNWDFLAFLWTWRVLLALGESVRPLRARAGWLLFAAMAALIVLLPRGALYQLFDLRGVPLTFPLLPWGGFVIAGLAWQRTEPRWRLGLLMLIGVATAAALGIGHFSLAKRPLNLCYLLAFTFLCLALSEGGRRMERAYRALPGLARGCEYLSQNLLTAMVLHYLPVAIVVQLNRYVWPSVAGALQARETLVLISAWALAFASIFGLLPAALAGWERVRMSPIAAGARRRIHVFAPLLILGALAPIGNLGKIAGWTYYPFHLPHGVELALFYGCRSLVLAAMFYFALELNELRRRGPAEPASRPTV